MKIVEEFPPNIEKIRATFELTGGEIFAWDDIIYNPSGGHLSTALIAHENVHKKQQNGDPESWWERYLVDAEWRLQQELEAHRVEYRWFCRENRDRNKQSKYLIEISKRLASPMYGSLLSQREAAKKIKQ